MASSVTASPKLLLPETTTLAVIESLTPKAVAFIVASVIVKGTSLVPSLYDQA